MMSIRRLCSLFTGVALAACSSTESSSPTTTTWPTTQACDRQGACAEGEICASWGDDDAPHCEGISHYAYPEGSCDIDGLVACGFTPDSTGSDAVFVWQGGVFQCTGGTWQVVFECPPLQDCINTQYGAARCGGTDVAYSMIYAVVGAPCQDEHTAACSFDQSEVLVCQAGAWALYATCATVNGCDIVPSGTPGCTHPDGCMGCA